MKETIFNCLLAMILILLICKLVVLFTTSTVQNITDNPVKKVYLIGYERNVKGEFHDIGSTTVELYNFPNFADCKEIVAEQLSCDTSGIVILGISRMYLTTDEFWKDTSTVVITKKK